MKRLLIALFFLTSFALQAQYYQKNSSQEEQSSLSDKSFWERVHFGGNLSMTFGNLTSVLVSPNAIYDFTDNFKAGVGLNYIYIKQETVPSALYPQTSLKSNLYGGKLLGYYTFLDFLMLSGEFEQNYRTFSVNETIYDPYWKSAFFLGIGYMIKFENGGGVMVSMSYDILYDELLSYWGSPFRPSIAIFF